MQFDNGYISAYMVTDPARMEAILEDAYIYLADRITSLKFTSFRKSCAKR